MIGRWWIGGWGGGMHVGVRRCRRQDREAREKTATTMTTAPATDVVIPATADAAFAFATMATMTATATATAARTKRELLLDRDGLGLCAALFSPSFRNRRGGLLAISLSYLNPQNHLGW